MKNRLALLLVVLLLLAARLLSQERTIVYTGNDERVKIGRYVAILEDSTGKMSVQDVALSNRFKASEAESPSLGVSASVFWVKFRIANTSRNQSLLLEMASPLTDLAHLYTLMADGSFAEQKITEEEPFSARKYRTRNYVFELEIPTNETHTYFLQVQSTELLQLPLTVGTHKGILESNMTSDLIGGVYFGIILIMFFYNLFIYATVRDKSYLYYVVYILFIGLTQANLHGYGSKYLWPASPWMTIHSIFLVPSLAGIVAILFVNYFLQVKRFAPKLIKFSYVIGTVYLVGIILGLVGKYDVSYNIIDFNALLLSIYMMWVAVKIARKGYRPAKFFLIAFSFFLVCVFIFVAKSKGPLPHNDLTNSILMIGSAVEVMLLSFALADRINILRREKEESQQQALETLKENDRIVREQNIILESRVKERTAELEASNKHLKDAQVQLVNAEKMASLGQLTAGIAHEINNPINFVISNVHPLKRDISEILEVLYKYGEIKDPAELPAKLDEIQKLKKKLDTDYVIKEIELLLKGIDEGAVRTSEIVKGLQNFSRLDEDGLKMANIHTGIDATLLLLNSNMNQKKITVVKNYGSFGDIECYPGKLNQVFMNILNNAMQAMDANAQTREIHISTQLRDDNKVIIRIRDTGPGMPEDVRKRVFEPFFTTKDVGEGSGLGLSIVYGIIEKHQGKIDVTSEPGKGTEFVIELPYLHTGS